MKANIHPNWNPDVKVVCACGNTFTVGSTVTDIRVELCAKCHPFYTGTQKLVDTQGQVEKFAKSQATSKAKAEERAKILAARVTKVQESNKGSQSLKDLLMQARKKAA